MSLIPLNAFNILNRMTDAFYMLDANWNFVYMNNKAEAILGYSKNQLLEQSFFDKFGTADFLPLHEKYIQAMKTQEVVSFEYYYPMKKQWFDVRAYPSSDGLSVYFLDIPDFSINSIETNQYYQSLFTNNPDAVYSLDLSGRYKNVNKAIVDMVGYSKEELLSMTYHTLIAEEDLQKTNLYFNEATNGTPQHYECKIKLKNNRIIHAKVTNIPITINSEVVGVYGIAKDITLQKVAEQNIENSEKLALVGQLSASVAHEIRNPLTTLKGFLQLVDEQNEISPNFIKIMLSEMDRIEMITSELLLLAKPQAVKFEEIEVKDIVNDVVTLLQSQALIQNVELIINYSEVGSINCVINQIKQVFINIIKNGIEAMPKGGVININLLNLDLDHVLIEVIDQGCGIPDDLAPNIGLPFYSTKEKGTGLGMLTTYKLVNDHGGKISFESNEGVGTTFRIQLPRKPL